MIVGSKNHGSHHFWLEYFIVAWSKMDSPDVLAFADKSSNKLYEFVMWFAYFMDINCSRVWYRVIIGFDDRMGVGSEHKPEGKA